MEIEFRYLRNCLKREYKRIRFEAETSNRLLSLAGQTLRIQELSINANWFPEIVRSYENLIQNFSRVTIAEITNLIIQTENIILDRIFTAIQVPSQYFNTYLNQARNTSEQQSLDFILPKMIYLVISNYLLANKVTESITFSDFKPILLHYFTAFHIPFNKFTNAVARKCLGNTTDIQHDFWNVNLACLEKFLQYFFGDIKNYKFYVKVARIFSECLENYQDIRFAQKVTLTPTTLRKDFQGEQTLVLYAPYQVEPVGILSNNYRGDGLVLFGKHQDADVIFPKKEPFIDQVSLIMYNCGNNYYLIDCCQKSYSAMKLEPNKQCYVQQGFMFNLAKTVALLVEKIQYEVIVETHGTGDTTIVYEKEDLLNSEIFLRCIEGPFKSQLFKFQTKQRDPQVLKIDQIIGTGGDGIAPDWFFPKDTGISRKHIVLKYLNNEWFAVDNDSDKPSTNGSFFILKNHYQYERKKHSAVFPTFNHITSDDLATILIGKYTFAVKKSNY